MARLFNPANSNYLDVAAAVRTAAPWTVSAWYKPTSFIANVSLWALSQHASVNDNRWDLRIDATTGKVSIGSRDTASSGATSTNGLTAGVWGHACGVEASSASRSVYGNGGGKATDTTTVNMTSLDRTAIGAIARTSPGASGNFANGILGEVAVWDVALTDAQILALANRANPWSINPDHIIMYVPVWGEDSPEKDFSKNRRSFSLNGTIAKAQHPPVWPLEFGSIFGGQTPGVTSVSKTLTPSFNIIQQISKAVTPSYNIRNTVTVDLNGTVGQTHLISYKIRNLVTKTVTPSYSIIQRISKTLSPAYNVHSLPVFLVNPVITGTPLSGNVLHEDGGTVRADPIDTVTKTVVWQVETAPNSGVYVDEAAETAVDLQI